MSEKTTLQIPINKSVVLKSEKKAKAAGFSSLQEFIRVFLHQFQDGKINFEINYQDAREKALVSKWNKAVKEAIANNLVKTFDTSEDLINDLDTI